MRVFDRIKNTLFSISKSFVQKQCPEEADFFDSIWDGMKDTIRKWENVPPAEWRLELPERELATDLGFADSAEVLDLITPIIIATVSATLIDLTKRGQVRLSLGEIKDKVESYARQFGALGYLVSCLVETVPDLCKIAYSGKLRKEIAEKIKTRKGLRKLVVYVNGERIENPTEEQLQEKWQDKGTFNIFIDESGLWGATQVYFDGTPCMKIKFKRTKYYQLLVILAMQPGRSYKKTDLYGLLPDTTEERSEKIIINRFNAVLEHLLSKVDSLDGFVKYPGNEVWSVRKLTSCLILEE